MNAGGRLRIAFVSGFIREGSGLIHLGEGGANAYGTALSSLRDEACKQSSPKASITFAGEL